MYFWNIESLAYELKANSLSEWQKAKYLIANLVINLSFASLSYLLGARFSLLSVASYTLGGITAAFCIAHVFNINHKADGKNFIERLVCFGLPATMRVGVYYLGFIVVFYIFSLNIHIPYFVSTLLHVFATTVVYLLTFHFIGNGFRAIHA
jgi:hypothetical protein